MLMVGNDGTASWNTVTLIAVLRRSGSVMMSALIFILFSFFFFFFFSGMAVYDVAKRYLYEPPSREA